MRLLSIPIAKIDLFSTLIARNIWGAGLYVGHLAAVLARGQAKPALASAKKIALVYKPQEVGHLTQAVTVFSQVLAGQVLSGAVQQILKGRAFFL